FILNTLRCYEPRGALPCGSPMPRGEQIAKPAERRSRLAVFIDKRHESWFDTKIARRLVNRGNQQRESMDRSGRLSLVLLFSALGLVVSILIMLSPINIVSSSWSTLSAETRELLAA